MAVLQYLILLMGRGFTILFFCTLLFLTLHREECVVHSQSLHLVDNFMSRSDAGVYMVLR